LELLEDRTVLDTYIVNLAGDAGISLQGASDIRYCITQANRPDRAGSTIVFDTQATGPVITLSGGPLTISTDMTISGPGASSLTISGNHSSQVFTIQSGRVNIAGLTISGGSAANGGGIYNAGTLTVSDSNLSGNSADLNPAPLPGFPCYAYGGGIYNAGLLTVSDSTIASNSANGNNTTAGPGTGYGGGIYSTGWLTITGSTLSGNSANGQGSTSGDGTGYGGGIYSTGRLTISDSTLFGNGATGQGGRWSTGGSGFGYGGGIYNGGGLTVTDSTLYGNSASGAAGGYLFSGGDGYGGGIYNSDSLTVINSTLSGNDARGYSSPRNSAFGHGGGIYNTGTLTITSSTLSGNSASISVGSPSYLDSGGGGIYNDSQSGLPLPMVHNTLIAGNLVHTSFDVYGNLDPTSDYNLIGDGSGGLDPARGNLLGSSSNPLNPLLAPLGNYGGPTQTMALLPGSPALDAASLNYAPATDQRGFPRVAAPDIGAFESQGFTLSLVSGNGQNAPPGTAFAQPLVVAVTARAAGEPVAGGQVTFVAPAAGATAVLSGNPALIGAAGQASVVGQAGGTVGTYVVTASAGGDAITVSFRLTNGAAPEHSPSTVGVFDPATAIWYIRYSNSPGAPNITPFAYGGIGWIGVVGDWDGNGTDTIGVVDGTGASDPNFAVWYLKNSNSPGAPDMAPFAYGMRSWIPVVGDWTGSGHTGIGVFDPTTATFYLRNSVSPGAADFVIHYGAPGWVPVVGDWDANGTTTIGVFDPGFATWYLRNSNGPGAPDIQPFVYGMGSWTPVTGEWSGGGTGIGVFDPTTATWYLRNSASPGAPDYAPFTYGGAGWQPVPGSFAPVLRLHAAFAEALPRALAGLPGDAELQGVVEGALNGLAQTGIDPTALQDEALLAPDGSLLA
jgi:hypothetical protein